MIFLMGTRRCVEQDPHQPTGFERLAKSGSGVQRDTIRWRRTGGRPPIQGGTGEASRPPQVDSEEPPSEPPLSLVTFADRVSYVVTDLNGLISGIVNEEVELSDFDNDLSELFDKLTELEGAVNELADVFWA